jgi:hypothetical protein
MSEEGSAKSQQRQDHVDGFFNQKGVVHHEYTPPDQTINKEYYIEVIHQLKAAARRKQLQLWASGDLHFNMTMCMPILHNSCRVFWQNITSSRLGSPLQPTFSSLHLLAFP